MAIDARTALLTVFCFALVLTCVGLLWASAAVDFDDRGPNSQYHYPPPQLQRYVSALMRRYDADGDGRLQASEWQRMRGQPAQIDHDGDLLLTHQELFRHVAHYGVDKRLVPARVEGPARPPVFGAPSPDDLAASSRAAPPEAKPFYVPDRFLPQGLPDWFRARDTNGDAQLSLAEYAPTGEAQLAAQFQRNDANRDGLITPAEAVHAAGRLETVPSTESRPPEKKVAEAPNAAP